MTDDPADYPSSYHHNAMGQPAPLITPHQQYMLLATTPATRQAAYRALVDELVEEKHLDDLRQHTQQQRAWGSERSRQQIEALTQRSVSVRPRGRPGRANGRNGQPLPRPMRGIDPGPVSSVAAGSRGYAMPIQWTAHPRTGPVTSRRERRAGTAPALFHPPRALPSGVCRTGQLNLTPFLPPFLPPLFRFRHHSLRT